MNERELRWLFGRIILMALPVPTVVLGAGCGGTSEASPSENSEAGTGGSAGPRGSTGTGGGGVVGAHRFGEGGGPPGLEAEPMPTRADLGGYFATMASLEAASVGAFRALRTELRAHGAPRALVRAAERAARDEIRHARMT